MRSMVTLEDMFLQYYVKKIRILYGPSAMKNDMEFYFTLANEILYSINEIYSYFINHRVEI